MTIVAWGDTYKAEEDNQLLSLTQAELNNLTRDLNYLKESTQVLGSCLKEKQPGTMFYWYQDCERELRQFFMFQNK